MTDIYIKQIVPVTINPLTVNPLTVAAVQKVAPIAVHLKELNQIAPLTVDSLRVDHVRHIDPLRIDRLNITQLPSVNLSLSQLPPLDINVGHVPPIAVALQQQLDLKSSYTINARFLGLTVMRMDLQGETRVTPRDCARREQSWSHARSFPNVAAAGNPAIPSRVIKTSTKTVTRRAPHRHVYTRMLRAGEPRFSYSLDRAQAKPSPSAGGGTMSFGGS